MAVNAPSNQIFFRLLSIGMIVCGATALGKAPRLLPYGKKTGQACSGVYCRAVSLSILNLVTVGLPDVNLPSVSLNMNLSFDSFISVDLVASDFTKYGCWDLPIVRLDMDLLDLVSPSIVVGLVD